MVELLSNGTPAPPFEAAGSDGRTYALSDVLGHHHVALILYPGNDTPG